MRAEATEFEDALDEMRADLYERVSELESEIERLKENAVSVDDLRDEIADYLDSGEYAKLDDLNDYIRDAFDNARRAV